MFKRVQDFFSKDEQEVDLIEGWMADEYDNADDRIYIVGKYNERYPFPVETPQTHPWKYDPLTPPSGWRYDPYCEIWLMETKK